MLCKGMPFRCFASSGPTTLGLRLRGRERDCNPGLASSRQAGRPDPKAHPKEEKSGFFGRRRLTSGAESFRITLVEWAAKPAGKDDASQDGTPRGTPGATSTNSASCGHAAGMVGPLGDGLDRLRASDL